MSESMQQQHTISSSDVDQLHFDELQLQLQYDQLQLQLQLRLFYLCSAKELN